MFSVVGELLCRCQNTYQMLYFSKIIKTKLRKVENGFDVSKTILGVVSWEKKVAYYLSMFNIQMSRLQGSMTHANK